ncbi:MAG TPA: DUF309 domain-containing protein [Bacilli bacterium]|nr:DUF309 domain-containing protein [Bacilli bacterium]
MSPQYPLEYYQFFISFNEGDYYTCHDLLEEIWLGDRSNLFIKGLLQMSVAIYHYEYGNIKGARMMLDTAKRYLESYRPFYWGIDLEKVHHFIERCLSIIPQHLERIPFEEVKTAPALPKLVLFLEDDSD